MKILAYKNSSTVAIQSIDSLFFIQVADLILVRYDNDFAYLIIFPEIEAFDKILEDHKEGFIACTKTADNKIKILDTDFSEKIAIPLRNSEFLRYLNITEEIYCQKYSYQIVEFCSSTEHGSIQEIVHIKDMSSEDLQLLLTEKVEGDDYEAAADIRDELRSRQ